MSDTDTLTFYVNGKKIEDDSPDPEMTLLTYLRTKLLLPGSKLGCGEGGCGACTVMISRYDWTGSRIEHLTVNACLTPVCNVHGMSVTTVEGIGSTKTTLHPVQERIAASYGSQCGFCTPGIVMSIYTLLRNKPDPSREDMESALEGNLCRCTGYRPILDGFETFTKEFKCGMGDQCCKKQPKNVAAVETPGKLFDATYFTKYDPTQEPIFPSELQLSDAYDRMSLTFKGSKVRWHRPTTLEELVILKAAHPTARLIIGNTEIGIEVKFKNMQYPVQIAATHVPELLTVTHQDSGVVFGGSASLTTMQQVLKKAIDTEPEYKTRVFTAIVDMLRWFAGHQIRNVAAIAGNIMTASPISDLNPLFLAAGCTLELASKEGGKRTIKMDENFFMGYRKTAVKPEEVLVSIHVPYTKKNEYFAGFKQAQRREDDIAIVNGGMRLVLNEDTKAIEDLALSFGGMAPFTKMATKTMKTLIGKRWDEDSTLQEACRTLEEDLPLPPGTPGGMESYRRTLTTSFFYKFYLTVLKHLPTQQGAPSIPATHLSATELYHRGPSKGVQVYEQPGPQQTADDAVGRPMPNLTADQQATGEAQYVDDIPRRTDELYLALVLSTKANAKLVSVDATPALTMEGVQSYVSRDDIPGNKMHGIAVRDEEIFAKDEVTCEGQVIGAIVADTQAQAQAAAKAVKVVYQERTAIVTIEDAITNNSFYNNDLKIHKGDVDTALGAAINVLQGEVKMGGQEHFYLETNATLAVPRGEDGEIEIFSSCQSPTDAQHQVAETLGIKANKVSVRVKRLGGGFGGKETQWAQLLLPVAVAANKMNRPVRCMLDRWEDMVVTGTRHPYLGKYKVGFNNDGTMTALDVQLYANAGNSQDLSAAVLQRAVLHVDNCYKVRNLRVLGRNCKTHISSNTAFRGFGGPQGMFVMEHIVSDIALKLNKKPDEIRVINLYNERDVTHFGQTLIDSNIRRCWTEVHTSAEFTKRSTEVAAFNTANRWKKRGIAVVPTKFGISFTHFVLNQAGALVHVYRDGSVLISHGGTEMGQGLHTKMIQVASRALGVPIEKIHVTETNTACVANTSPTAASASSDLNGMAVLNACNPIKDRLTTLKATMPSGTTWEQLVMEAYNKRISLSQNGFYKTPDIGFDWEKGTGMPFNYFTFGAACSEVEIDCLTGDHTVRRTDIVMDLGKSLNPGVDIGQIEGGFVQGQGLFTLEFQRYSPSGSLFSRGPGFYKLPGAGDIPVEFNVSLLKESDNERAVYSSKAIGEPPLFLASSIFFAIKEAVAAARAESEITGPFRLDSPATAWRIRMACTDEFTKQFPEADPTTYTPWFVEL